VNSSTTRALTIAAALCGLALARPTTVYAPAAPSAGPERLLFGLEVPTERYLDVGAGLPKPTGPAGYVAAPAPWEAEPAWSALPGRDRERRYLDVGALGLRAKTTEPPAR